MEAPASPKKLRGVVKLAATPPVARLWELASDFCGLNKWMPSVEQSFRVEGEGEKTPGCVRRVIGTSVARDDGEKSWVDERLVSFDEANHSLSYAIEAGNIAGLQGYSATLRVFEPGGEDPGARSVVEWSFEMDEDPGASSDAAIEFISGILRRNIKDLVAAAENQFA